MGYGGSQPLQTIHFENPDITNLTTQLAQIATNIKTIGAVGDGVTNNTTIIQNALNSNKIVLIPDGVFMVDSITIINPVKIIGNGTLKLRSGNTNSIITIRADNCIIDGITLDGNNNTFGYAQGCVLVDSGTNNTKIRNCIIDNGGITVCGDKAIIQSNILNNSSIVVLNSKHNTIESNVISPPSNVDGISVHCDGDNQYITLHNKILKNRIYGCTRIGIEVCIYSQYTIVSNNYIQMVDSVNTYFAISISHSPNSIVSDNYMECTSNINIAALEITYSSDNTVCARNTIYNFKRGFQLSVSNNNVSIIENVISNIYETGIWATGGPFNNITIERNKISINTDDSTIEQRGINWGVISSNVNIFNNTFTLISNLTTVRNLFGISLSSTVSNCTIRDNIFNLQCVTQSVFQAGIYSFTGSNITIDNNIFTDVNGSKCCALLQYGGTLSDTLKIRNNLFNGLYQAIHCEGSTNSFILLSHNNYQSVVALDGLIASYVINRLINQGNHLYSVKEVNGTATPTTGTWNLGDRVINRTPAVGSPKSWICTVSGTPGTWVSEGNL